MLQISRTEIKSLMVSSITTEWTLNWHCGNLGVFVVFYYYYCLTAILRKILISIHIFPLQQSELKSVADSWLFTVLIMKKCTRTIKLTVWDPGFKRLSSVHGIRQGTADTAGRFGISWLEDLHLASLKEIPTIWNDESTRYTVSIKMPLFYIAKSPSASWTWTKLPENLILSEYRSCPKKQNRDEETWATS